MTDTEKAALERRIDELCAEVERGKAEFKKMDVWHSQELKAAMDENAKLRELVGDIWEFGFSNSAGANSVKEWYRVRDELEQRVYAALGVDDG